MPLINSRNGDSGNCMFIEYANNPFHFHPAYSDN